MKTKHGFNAFGHPVPANRLDSAYKLVREILPTIKRKTAISIVKKCANSIERDQPFAIIGAVAGLDKQLDKIDLTGRYRLLSVLLTDETSNQQNTKNGNIRTR